MHKAPTIALTIHASHRVRRDFLRGVAKYARVHGPWNLTPAGDARGLSIEQVRQEGIDGIIGDITEEIAACALDLGVAMVATNPFPKEQRPDSVLARLSSVNFDTADKIAALAIDHFTQRNFQHFAYVGYSDVSWSSQREMAFQSKLSEIGVECAVFHQTGSDRGRDWEVEQPALTHWIEELPKPVAILACNDERGREVLDACFLAGISVPSEVAVLGVDNDDVFCSIANPPMSSVVLNADAAGYRAAELIEGQLKKTIQVPQRIDIEAIGIITRLSTDSVVVEEPDVAAAMRRIRELHGIGVTVGELADELSVSQRTLQKLFRKSVGRTVFEEIQLARLEYAQQLLLETALSIEEVAVKSGFDTHDYFVQVFRRRVGVSPRKFRLARGADG